MVEDEVIENAFLDFTEMELAIGAAKLNGGDR